ncbi:MAG: alginate export family protein [Sulfurimonas sp.]
MIKMSMAAVMVMGVSSVSVQANDILTNIKAQGQIRARYEMVDAKQTPDIPNANAFTNRLTLGVSADLLGTSWLSAYAEMTDVRALNDNYNSQVNNSNNEVVLDSEQTRVTQAYLDMKYGKTKLRVGRQGFNLDNLRFVGTVDWRQMPQTFDAYTLTDSTVENLNLFASYVTQVNRVTHESLATGNWDTRTLLLNASYKVMPELKVTVYDYMIGEGTGNLATGGNGSDTYGIALTGEVKVAEAAKLTYRAEYAEQTDPSMENSGSTTNINVDANYMNLQLCADVSGILAGIQYEALSGANDSGTETAFQTPLATLHAHNGFADMFMTTPEDGLEDLSISLGYKSKEFGMLKATYHDYTSEVGSVDYGTELDVTYARAIPGVNNLSGLLKVADYNADSSTAGDILAGTTRNVDTTKFWAMLDYKFATK